MESKTSAHHQLHQSVGKKEQANNIAKHHPSPSVTMIPAVTGQQVSRNHTVGMHLGTDTNIRGLILQ